MRKLTLAQFGISNKGVVVDLILADTYSSFDVSSVKENGNRKTLALRLPKSWDEPFECMEACVKHEIGEQSDVFFSSDVDSEQLLSK
jgi:hypothetical protein